MILRDRDYINQALKIYEKVLKETITCSTHFGILEDKILKAVASVKCYSGKWYLRTCVVKKEYRGQGLQKQLIKERLEYLAERTDVVRVSVYPSNYASIKNIEDAGFEFEKDKKLKNNGKVVHVYKKKI